MGQARRRGTYEQRKAEAIAAGRIVEKRRSAARIKRAEKRAMINMVMELLRKSSLGAIRR